MEDKLKYLSRKIIIANLFVILISMLIAYVIYTKSNDEYIKALDNYKINAHHRSLQVISDIENVFNLTYQTIRTIGKLPDVRNIDRNALNFSHNANTTIQELYNNLVTNVAVSEIYIVPNDFNHKEIDKYTGLLEEPAH